MGLGWSKWPLISPTPGHWPTTISCIVSLQFSNDFPVPFLGGHQYSWDIPPGTSSNLPIVQTICGYSRGSSSIFIGGRKYKWDYNKPPDSIVDYWGPSHHLHLVNTYQAILSHMLGGKNYRWDFHLVPSHLSS